MASVSGDGYCLSCASPNDILSFAKTPSGRQVAGGLTGLTDVTVEGNTYAWESFDAVVMSSSGGRVTIHLDTSMYIETASWL